MLPPWARNTVQPGTLLSQEHCWARNTVEPGTLLWQDFLQVRCCSCGPTTASKHSRQTRSPKWYQRDHLAFAYCVMKLHCITSTADGCISINILPYIVFHSWQLLAFSLSIHNPQKVTVISSNTNVYDGVIIEKPLQEFSQFIWWIQNSAKLPPTIGQSQQTWIVSLPVDCTASVHIHCCCFIITRLER